MTIYVSQCEGCSHNNQHDQSNQDPNQGFGHLSAPLKFYMVVRAFQDIASSSLLTSTNPLLAQPVTEKLTKLNHALWHAQVRATIRGARLLGFLTGDSKASPSKIMQKDTNGKEVEVLNPEYEDWEATDQQVLSYLLSSLSKEILTQVSSGTTTVEAWKEIQGMFASQKKAWTVNTRLALGNTCKGDMSVAEYFEKMKDLGDEMKAASRPLYDEELVEYIITNLDEEFTPLVSALCARVEPISISELFSQLLNFETRVNLFSGDHHHSANSMGRECEGTRGQGGTRGRGGHDGT
jgi:hypothetical protein